MSSPGPTPPGSSEPAVRVLVVDDDPLVRTGLVLILGGGRGIEVVGEAVDGLDGVAAAERLSPDVVLMDVRMPRLDGIAATERLTERPGGPSVVVLTTFDADDMVLRALRAGAAGFLLKDTAPDRLVDAVRAVAAGDPMLSPSVTAQLIAAVTGGGVTGGAAEKERTDRRQAARSRLDRLTEREREVAEAVAQGLDNTEITERLYMSIGTVKAHVGRLFTKLEVDNRVQVAILVRDAED